MKHSHFHENRQGLTLVEVLVLVAILVVLALILMTTVRLSLQDSTSSGMVGRGKLIYQMVCGTPYSPDNPSLILPSSKDGYGSSTEYFKEVYSELTVPSWFTCNMDFSLFSEVDLPHYRTLNPKEFKPDGNAWNVALDVWGAPSPDTPLFFTRNLLSERSHMVGRTETLSPDMLRERNAKHTLSFDRQYAVGVTKAGAAIRFKKKDFSGGTSAELMNPADYRGPFLKP